MKSRLTAFIGPAFGLALAVGLLYPEADPDTLAAQGATALLKADLEGAFGDSAPSDVPAGQPLTTTAAAEASVFAALHRLTGDGDAIVGLSVTLQGAPTSDGDFERAFSTNLNSYNAFRRAHGLPAAALAAPGDLPDLRLDLNVGRNDHSVSIAARVANARDAVAVTPQDDSGAVRSWRVPKRSALMPPLLAIVIALLIRRTVLSLFVGIWVGAAIMAHQTGTSTLFAPVQGLWDVFAHYLRHEVVDTFRIEIIGFVIALVAMVGIMSRSGGVHGLIEKLLGFARTVRSTMAVTWGMGLVIFFDDYANCLLVGNTMRPLTDRMRISREKLAYLVDSTAAPVAGLSLLSTWIAFEVSTYQAQLPGAGINDSAYSVFLQTIPYRYYCLFTLAFVGLLILTQRDYGPMLRAETRARIKGQLVRPGSTPTVSEEMTRIAPKEGMQHHWRNAVLPISCVLLVTIGAIFGEGGGFAMLSDDRDKLFSIEGFTQVLYAGSGGAPIFIGATWGLLLAVFLVGSVRTRIAMAVGLVLTWELKPALTWLLSGSVPAAPDAVFGAVRSALPEQPWAHMPPQLAGYLSFGLLFAVFTWVTARLVPDVQARRSHLAWVEIRRAGFSSLRALFFAIIILFEAWMIGEVCKDLHTADYLVALLSGSVSPTMLPVLLFTVACVVAFATGSSWSTMSILLPNVVALAAAVGIDAGMGALAMVVMCIGAILEGSIFGDHCSPISDTTVLSSVSSAADHMDHVRTQAPYALTTGAVAIVFGYIPSVALPWWNLPLALATGLTALLTILFLVGKRTPEAEPPAHSPSRPPMERAPAEAAS